MPAPLLHDADVLAQRPGAVLLAETPVFPGGGGQLADRALLAWPGGGAEILHVEPTEAGFWHEVAGAAPAAGTRVTAHVDAAFRRLMSELHTLAHIANSVVYRAMDGALLTGAQLSANGTFRVDFDLPGGEGAMLRSIDDAINAIIRADMPVTASRMVWEEAARLPGLFRSRGAVPPRAGDGSVRIVSIGTIDSQACGGTHLARTGEARCVRVLKVDNKGRHNRRVKLGFAES